MVGVASVACGGSAPRTTQVAPAGAPATAEQGELDQGFGGRLFDNWVSELEADFKPDDPKTQELDGTGGPFGNGTLPGPDGKPQPNTGHGYRLKNLMGWDLRGAEGVYGADYQSKSYVLQPNLLTDTDDRAAWVRRITQGEDGIPGYGAVLDEAQIGALVDFLLAERDGGLPQASDIWTLSKEAPKNYELVAGGDATAGQALYAERCAECHGDDGTAILIDDGAYSLGMYGRMKAYEAWIKVLNGQPGTSMDAQLDLAAGRTALVKQLRDLFAALCDRGAFPRGNASKPDVADGDARCGALLK